MKIVMNNSTLVFNKMSLANEALRQVYNATPYVYGTFRDTVLSLSGLINTSLKGKAIHIEVSADYQFQALPMVGLKPTLDMYEYTNHTDMNVAAMISAGVLLREPYPSKSTYTDSLDVTIPQNADTIILIILRKDGGSIRMSDDIGLSISFI